MTELIFMVRRTSGDLPLLLLIYSLFFHSPIEMNYVCTRVNAQDISTCRILWISFTLNYDRLDEEEKFSNKYYFSLTTDWGRVNYSTIYKKFNKLISWWMPLSFVLRCVRLLAGNRNHKSITVKKRSTPRDSSCFLIYFSCKFHYENVVSSIWEIFKMTD